MSVNVCVLVRVCEHLDVWGELASHKRSLIHRPSSQGYASRCPLLYMLVCLGHGWVGYLSFLSYFHTLVC